MYVNISNNYHEIM